MIIQIMNIHGWIEPRPPCFRKSHCNESSFLLSCWFADPDWNHRLLCINTASSTLIAKISSEELRQLSPKLTRSRLGWLTRKMMWYFWRKRRQPGAMSLRWKTIFRPNGLDTETHFFYHSEAGRHNTMTLACDPGWSRGVTSVNIMEIPLRSWRPKRQSERFAYLIRRLDRWRDQVLYSDYD